VIEEWTAKPGPELEIASIPSDILIPGFEDSGLTYVEGPEGGCTFTKISPPDRSPEITSAPASSEREDTSEAGYVDMSSGPPPLIRAPPPTGPPRPAPEKPRWGQVSRCCNVA
jgi:hypothetical protein